MQSSPLLFMTIYLYFIYCRIPLLFLFLLQWIFMYCTMPLLFLFQWIFMYCRIQSTPLLFMVLVLASTAANNPSSPSVSLISPNKVAFNSSVLAALTFTIPHLHGTRVSMALHSAPLLDTSSSSLTPNSWMNWNPPGIIWLHKDGAGEQKSSGTCLKSMGSVSIPDRGVDLGCNGFGIEGQWWMGIRRVGLRRIRVRGQVILMHGRWALWMRVGWRRCGNRIKVALLFNTIQSINENVMIVLFSETFIANFVSFQYYRYQICDLIQPIILGSWYDTDWHIHTLILVS